MAKRKQIGRADMTGDKGIALIHRIVNDMDFVWNALHLESGIDGIIEIRDSVTAEVSNCIIQVQSKAGQPLRILQPAILQIPMIRTVATFS